MGLLSVLFAGFMLYRRGDVKRFFAYSSVEHMGIIAFAFGLGGPLANFAGLLHMAMHSLTKSGIFYAVGHMTRIKGSQAITDIRGLTSSHPLLGWIFVFSVAAIAGLPPFGVFTSEFLVISSAFAQEPLLATVLVLGLLVSLGALFLRLNGLAFGEPTGSFAPSSMSHAPMLFHLGLVLVAGVFLPPAVAGWFQHVARLLG
jgi:hydrogenase-4 component F